MSETSMIRPITVLAGLGAIVAVLAVTFAWWPGDDSTTVGQPSALPIVLGGRAETAMAPASTVYGTTTYVRGPALPDLDGTQVAWRIPAVAPGSSAMRKLADGLGVRGELRPVPDGSAGGAWQVGDADGSGGASLWISSTGAWSYTAAGASVAVSCASGQECPAPPPPADVPDEAAAEAQATRVLRSIGFDTAHADPTTRADEWAASVTASPVLGGTPTAGFDTTIAFGGDAAITYASGWLAVPTRADTYPLIGTSAAIGRLNRGVDVLGPLMLAEDTPAIATDIAPVPETIVPTETTMPVTTVPDPDSTTTTIWEDPAPCVGYAEHGPAAPLDAGAADTTTTITAPPSTAGMTDGCSVPVDPYPGPTVVPDPAPGVERTITITSATVVLVATPGSDGATWLVPAYRLGATDADGADLGTWYVLAVDESFVAPPSDIPPATFEPPGTAVEPGSTGGGGGSTGATTPGSSVEPQPPITTGTTQAPSTAG